MSMKIDIYFIYTLSFSLFLKKKKIFLRESFLDRKRFDVDFLSKSISKLQKYEKEKSTGWLILKRLPTRKIDVTKFLERILCFDKKIWVSKKD